MHSASHQVYAVEIDSAISLYCKELQHTSKHPPVFNIRFIDDEINCKQVAFISLSSLKSKLWFLFRNSRILRKYWGTMLVDSFLKIPGYWQAAIKYLRIAAKHMKAPVIGLKGLFVYIFASNICLTVKNVFVLIPKTTPTRPKWGGR